MEKIKNYALIGLSIIVVLLTIRTCKQKDTVTVDVPVRIEVPVPVVKKVFDTIYKPYPVYTKPNTIKVIEYVNATDEKKDSLYKEAVTVRQYNEKFEDEYIVGNIFSETTGTLDKQSFKYETKPRTITVDTTVRTTLEVPYRTRFFIGGELGMPLQRYDEINESIIRNNIQARVNIGIDSKNIIYNGALDTNKYLWFGAAYKF